MPNVQVENYALAASNDKFSLVWKMTRAMKRAGWRYKASSDGTNKEATGSPAADKWGGGVQVGSQTGSAAMSISSPSTSAYGGRATVSGMSGASFTANSVGNFLTITGATNSANNGTFLITNYISATSVNIENPSAVAETTPGGATWTEVSALNDAYPALGAGAWLVLQGPSTLKVPIGTTVPTGTFIKGENVTQASSGATGEIVGVLTDTINGGFLVIAPRLSGTSGGVRGWSNSAAITGAVSGASISPVSTIVEYVREVVFWRSSTTAGHIYYQCIDSVGEGTTNATNGRFSTMASLGTCTATVCPGGASGGNPTTNGFPTTGTLVAGIGTGGTGAVGTGTNDWLNNTNSVNLGLGHVLVANAIEDTNSSGDGSMTWVAGIPSAGAVQFVGCGFLRVDDQEDGDVDPYVWAVPVGSAYSRSRTGGGGTSTAADGFGISAGNHVWYNAGSSFLGWRRRGWGTNEAFSEFNALMLSYSPTSFTTGILLQASGTPDKVACSFSSVAVREPMWIVCFNGSNPAIKLRKGTLRWWFAVQGGNGCDTYDGRRWIQLSSQSAPNGGPAIVVGPADGTTMPLNQ